MSKNIIPNLTFLQEDCPKICEDIISIYEEIVKQKGFEFFESDLYKDMTQYERMFVRGFLYCLVAEGKLKVVGNYGNSNYNRIRYKVKDDAKQ